MIKFFLLTSPMSLVFSISTSPFLVFSHHTIFCSISQRSPYCSFHNLRCFAKSFTLDNFQVTEINVFLIKTVFVLDEVNSLFSFSV